MAPGDPRRDGRRGGDRPRKGGGGAARPPEDAKGLLEDALKMARESNLSAVETEAATSALYRVEKQMNETWVDPRAELEDLEVKEEL